MKKELKITKKTVFILILILVVSAVMGFGIKDRLSRQDGDGNYVAPTNASVWDIVYDEEPDVGNESGKAGEQDVSEGESLPTAEPALPPTGNRAEPEILDSDIIWFDDRYASCYDHTTDLWLVYEARVGDRIGIFGDRIVYRYDAADSRWESFASKSPDDLRMIQRQIITSGDMLYLWQWNNTTWVEHSKEGSTLKLGSGRVWFSEGGADCYDGLHTIDSSISAEDGSFSCVVSGGIPPITYNWRADPDGQIGDAISFEPELSDGAHNITLVVTDASGRSAEDTVEVLIT
uniref:Uncharacterized protein n=1 Tax=Candidatus Methanogaster sp. ANME-2c ERB4 TaxID=2759911 RepID=A0A7G9YR44_9EURY|nr:hypothetical protein EGLMOMJH_00017 [Methanosarcinales archaeon ANME-2c ERB4]